MSAGETHRASDTGRRPAAWSPERAARRRGPLAYARGIFTEPFTATPEDVLRLPRRQYERRRRAGLLRLILVTFALALLIFVIPVAFFTSASTFYLVTLVAECLLSIVCLVINGWLSGPAAATCFVFGTLILGLNFPLENPAGLDAQGLLLYATLSLVPLIAGLVLPMWVVWLAGLTLMAATATGVYFTPLAPSLAGPPGASFTVRLTALTLLVADQALATIFAWVYARSSAAGVGGALHAVARERELTELKDQFLIDANHELRTPIMVWYTNTELLQRLGERATAEQRERSLGRALIAGRTVLRLLAAVLDAGALESGAPPLSLRPVALAALVRSVVEGFDPALLGGPGPDAAAAPSRPPIQMEAQDEVMVMADADRVRQVLVNLLTNAVKYSAPDTLIAVSVALQPPAPLPIRRRRGRRAAPAAPLAPAFAVVGVRDRGLGVPPADAHKLFQRFVRLERDVAGTVRGTGVGLYLSRVLVEAMGGRIWVESSGVAGEGSTFSFTLPLAPASPDAPPAAERGV